MIVLLTFDVICRFTLLRLLNADYCTVLIFSRDIKRIARRNVPEIQRTVQPPYFTRANVLESFRISRNGYCNHILQRITLIRLIMRRVRAYEKTN